MTFQPMAGRARLNTSPQRASVLLLPIVPMTALIATLGVNLTRANAQEASNPCEGLPPIKMSVFLDVLERQGSLTKTTTAPSRECSLTLTLEHEMRGNSSSQDSEASVIALPGGAHRCTYWVRVSELWDDLGLRAESTCTSY